MSHLTNGSVLSFTPERGQAIARTTGDEEQRVTQIGWAVVLYNADDDRPGRTSQPPVQASRIEPVILYAGQPLTATRALAQYDLRVEPSDAIINFK